MITNQNMNSSGYVVNVSNVTSYVAISLQEFEVYGFEIAAMTVIGLGPFSDVIANQTFEDGKYTVYITSMCTSPIVQVSSYAYFVCFHSIFTHVVCYANLVIGT